MIGNAKSGAHSDSDSLLKSSFKHPPNKKRTQKTVPNLVEAVEKKLEMVKMRVDWYRKFR